MGERIEDIAALQTESVSGLGSKGKKVAHVWSVGVRSLCKE